MKKIGITLIALALISFGVTHAQDFESKITKMEAKSTPMSTKSSKKEKKEKNVESKESSEEREKLPREPRKEN